MSHLDWVVVAMLCLLVLMRLFRSFKLSQRNVYRISSGQSETKLINNSEDAIKELDNLQELIKHGDNSKVKVIMRTVDKIRGATTETEINNPEEELKIINDIEEKLKHSL